MKITNNITLSRLIAKIDNDFNLSESDWIPRVAAWTIDALSQLHVLPTERKKRTLEVSERVAIFPCTLDAKSIKVYDKNGIEIKDKSEHDCNCGNSSTGELKGRNEQIAFIDDTNKTGVNFMTVATTIPDSNRYFILDGNNIELNFDTDSITVESEEVATYYDEYYECDCPYIINDGLLLEVLSWYCLFKYLSRGSKHTVYSLTSPNSLLNPHAQWLALKYKAANSAKKTLSKNMDKGWNNFFYNSTFLPRS